MINSSPTKALGKRQRFFAKSLSVVCIWLGLYPILLLSAWVLEPMIKGMPLFMRCLVMSWVLVPVMVLLVSPIMSRLALKLSGLGQVQKELCSTRK